MKPIDRRCRGYWSGVMALAMIAVAPVVAWGQAGQVVQAGPEWVGQRVITRFGAVLQADGRVIDDEKLENRSRGGKRREFRIYRVEEVNGPWLLLKQERGTANGWITAGWLIPLDGAFEFFKKEIAANPGNASAYLYRGHLWKDARQYDNAIADYNQAIRIDPGNEGAWLGRGVALSLKNDPAKALVDFNEAIRLDPSDTKAYNNRGNTWSARGDFDRAIADYGEAMRLDPGNPVSCNNRGNAWRAKQEYGKAIADYDEAIRREPRYAAAYANRAIAWYDQKKYEEAIADYGDAVRLDPRDVYSNFYRSLCQFILHQEDASAGFQAVLDGDSGRSDLSTYAWIVGHLAARQAGHDPQARVFLERARVLNPAAWPFPVVQYLQGQIDEAKLLALAVDDRKRTEAHCFLGLDQAIKGQDDKALAHFRWVRDHGVASTNGYDLALAELARRNEPTMPASK